jgi:DNA-binding NarL/FixJ family response regulator
VVIADDHPSMLKAFARLLESSCDVVASVPNGHAAVDAVTTLKPDLLIVDLMMPDLDGLEVCRRVKQAVPEADVIIITAFDDAHVESVVLQAGASAFVAKHSAAGSLKPAIQRILSTRRRERS